MGHIKSAALLVMLISIVLTTGCSSPFSENNIIEEIAPVVFWYMDEGREGKLKISTMAPPLIKEKKYLLTREVHLLNEGTKLFNLAYYRELKPGQLRMLLINERLAKKGILSLLNTVATDPDVSQRLYLVIVDGNFDTYIKKQLVKQPNLDYFLYRMLRHYEENNQGEITVVNLHQFMKTFYSPFSYPILPVFKVDKENFTYKGTALFHHDKLIATVKNTDDQFIQLMNNNHYLKYLPIPTSSVTLGHVRSNVHMKLNPNYSSLLIKVNLKSRIEEYGGNKNILDHDELASLNKEIESYLDKQSMDFFKKMQNWNVDPLQIGTLSLNPWEKPLSEKQWSHYWKRMKINVDYHLHPEPLTNVK